VNVNLGDLMSIKSYRQRYQFIIVNWNWKWKFMDITCDV